MNNFGHIELGHGCFRMTGGIFGWLSSRYGLVAVNLVSNMSC